MTGRRPDWREWVRGAAVALGIAGVVVACGKAATPSPANAARSGAAERPNANAVRSPDGGHEEGPARSHALATIARTALGPFAARRPEGGIVAWIVRSGERADADLAVVPLATDGAALGAPRILAGVPRETTSLVVRRANLGGQGWLVLWSAVLDRGEGLTLLAVAPDGSTKSAPIDLQRTSDHIAWADLLPTANGALCLWAEETTDGGANLLTVRVDSSGRPAGMPARVTRGVRRWSAVPTEDGVALALVAREGQPPVEALSWLRLNGDGVPRGPAIPIDPRLAAEGDVEIAHVQNRWLLAWTDRSGEDPEVAIASVDDGGHVEPASHPLNASGGSSLVAIASGPQGAALAWDDLRGRARPTHLLHLATLSTQGRIVAQPVTSLAVLAGSGTELTATERGFALLATPVESCLAQGPRTNSCFPGVPTFLNYDEHLALSQTEPLFVGETHAPATLAWALECAGQRCTALAATADVPTPIFSVDLRPRRSPYAAPVAPSAPADAPRAAGLTTLSSGQPFADVVSAAIGARAIVATMTGYDPPARRGSDAGATISVRAIDEAGQPVGPPQVLTSRALPVGRVAIAAAPAADGGGSARVPSRLAPGAVVAWVKRDDGDPQVHLAKLDTQGHRTRETQLTTVKGDASDVALAWVGDGYVVAWVDWRDGNGEVYAARVDADLNRKSRDERITRAPGDAADVALAVDDAAAAKVVWLAWSDPRESPREGLGDIYVTTLNPRDASRGGEEVRVLPTAAHSRSPQLAAIDGGAIIAWIESAPPGLDAPGGAMFARLDARGQVVGSVERLDGVGRPTAIALAPARGYARAVVARSTGDVVTLDALRWGSGSAPATAPESFPLIDLNAPAPFEVALALAGDSLFYDDKGTLSGDRRVRRMTISWPGAQHP